MSDIVAGEEIEGFLEHFGVKGMRWGVRKDDSSSSSGAAPKTKKPSRKEARAANRAAKDEFYQEKASRVFEKAANSEVLISLKTGYDAYPTIVTGKEFYNYAMNGGAFDIKLTDVFAEQLNPGEQYTLNDRMNERYKKQT